MIRSGAPPTESGPRKTTISVFGLGYVGSVCCGCFCRQGHRVIGVDINPGKVELINAGRSPVAEPGLDEMLRSAASSGLLTATIDVREALDQSDITLICVGTPSLADGSINLAHVICVTKKIMAELKQTGKEHILLFRSTMLPGPFNKLIAPLLSDQGDSARINLRIAYNPEFMREGSAIEDFYHPPKTVIGLREEDAQLAGLLLELYSFVSGDKFVTDIGTAQMIKYADNIFHGLKVSFANEIGLACRHAGLDSHRVMEIFCRDAKLNLSSSYLRPGKPFGGSCLPKDIKAFCRASEKSGFHTPLISNIMASNNQQIAHIVDWLESFDQQNIGLIGLSFKADTDDLRNSPAVAIARGLLENGRQVAVYDPNLIPGRLVGENLSFLNLQLPQLSEMLCPDLDEFRRRTDLAVIFNSYPETNSWLASAGSPRTIVDLIRVGGPIEGLANYHGLYW